MAVYFPFDLYLNLSTVIIDLLKQNFPCDVFVGVSMPFGTFWPGKQQRLMNLLISILQNCWL